MVEEAFQLNSDELSKAVKSAGFKLESVTIVAEVRLRQGGETLFADLGSQSWEVIANELAWEVLHVGEPVRLELLLRETSGSVKLEAVAKSLK